VTVAQQGILNIEYDARARGLTPREVEEAVAFQKLDDHVTRTGRGWEQLQKAYATAKAAGARWLPEAPEPKDSWLRAFYRGIMDFDPMPYWEKVHCPLLAFFGQTDWIVPPVENEKHLRQAVEQAGNKNVQIVILPKANHLFLEVETGTMEEFPRLKNFVPQYFPTMAKWVSASLPHVP
jgi:pimeloyl-ACP methyl ester carboxylesterase